MRMLPLLLSLAILPGMASAQQNPSPDKHSEGVVKRGEHVMGFSHEATTHHFRLFNDGGEIDLTANNSKDKASIDQIRTHFGHIAKMFAFGNFKAPMLIHDTNPPGTATMTRLKEQIRYGFSETDRGARIRLITSSPETTDAVHALPALSNRRPPDTRRPHDIRRSSEEVVIPGGIPRRFYPAILPLPLSR